MLGNGTVYQLFCESLRGAFAASNHDAVHEGDLRCHPKMSRPALENHEQRFGRAVASCGLGGEVPLTARRASGCPNRPHCSTLIPLPVRPPQQCHRQIRPDPRPCRRKSNIRPVLRVADHSERRQQVPDTAPGRRRRPAMRRHGRIEHHVHRIGRCRRRKDSYPQPRIYLHHRPHLALGISSKVSRKSTRG